MESENRSREKNKRRGKARRIAQVDAAQLWAEIEDHLVPFLRPRLGERVVYLHLVRSTRLAGRRVLQTSIAELAKALCVCKTVARDGIRRLAKLGALKIVGCGRNGHKVEVRVPREIPGCVRKPAHVGGRAMALENCVRSRAARLAIFEREKHHCFYCLRQLDVRNRVLDHVVPRKRGGGDNYRNVVACCPACNGLKKTSAAVDFLRRLHRQNLIGRREFYRRIMALRDLKEGRLKPELRKAA